MRYLCVYFSLPRPLCSRLRPDVRDRHTSDRRTSDVRQASDAHHRLMPPSLGAGHSNTAATCSVTFAEFFFWQFHVNSVYVSEIFMISYVWDFVVQLQLPLQAWFFLRVLLCISTLLYYYLFVCQIETFMKERKYIAMRVNFWGQRIFGNGVYLISSKNMDWRLCPL